MYRMEFNQSKIVDQNKKPERSGMRVVSQEVHRLKYASQTKETQNELIEKNKEHQNELVEENKEHQDYMYRFCGYLCPSSVAYEESLSQLKEPNCLPKNDRLVVQKPSFMYGSCAIDNTINLPISDISHISEELSEDALKTPISGLIDEKYQ